MGNHAAGRMFVSFLNTYTDDEINKMTQYQALSALDRIGKVVIETTSLDAEFDDHSNPNQKLGRVLIKAFLPDKYEEWKEKNHVDEEMDREWYYKVWKPFTERFGFC